MSVTFCEGDQDGKPATYEPENFHSFQGGDGGNVSFTPGPGFIGAANIIPGKHGSIKFMAVDGKTEILTLTGYGEIFVNGKKIVDDFDAYLGLVSWLRAAGVSPRIDEAAIVESKGQSGRPQTIGELIALKGQLENWGPGRYAHEIDAVVSCRSDRMEINHSDLE